ncbi:hypothetical protein NP493_3g06001 [Ridgeia piscesae]|uniref:PA14 domain-containing protein n=1 Tax=Ridgeia piscesae TaxID=27915 RepID=A0AAD9PFT0_RIDPI|nr:hypothetical protein NP493_3g06001 [Ridgeia piscesae]
MYRTPRIDQLTPRSGPPGTMVTMEGVLYTSLFGPNEMASTNGKTAKFLRVYFGSQKCEAKDPNQVEDVFYGLQLDRGGTSDHGSLKCKLLGSYVGKSLPVNDVLRVTAQNKLAMFQSHAVVTGVSPATGSLEGGTTITVEGQFFDETETTAKVDIDGVSCVVTDVKDENITCVVPRKPTKTITSYAGNRGTLLEWWTSTDTLDTVSDSVASPEGTETLDEWQWSDTVQDNFVSRTRAYFVPPSDNGYEFVVTAEDEAMVWLSPSDDPAAKVRWLVRVYGTKLPNLHVTVLSKDGTGELVSWRRSNSVR